MIIAFPHKPQEYGGPGSFQIRIEALLRKKGWKIIYADQKSGKKPDLIFVVGGTRKIGWLLWHKLSGVPIILRLDGINWLHRKSKVSISKYITDEIRNLLFQVIRTFFAVHIIYQSTFVQKWWQIKGWKSKAESSIIHNGVDIDLFKPSMTSNGRLSLLAVEGNLDYSPYSIRVLNGLQKLLLEHSNFNSLILYGGFQSERNRKKLNRGIHYKGIVPRSKLPGVYKNGIYISLDINAACPNTVIEAMASGLPVIGFDTGALRELVPEGAGEIVPYGSDPWQLDFPKVENLFHAAVKVSDNWQEYSKAARKHAEDNFDIERVVDQYIVIIESVLNK